MRSLGAVDVELSGNMDVLERHYGRVTFTLYALFANVPTKKEWPRKIFIIFSTVSLFLVTIFQIIKLVVEGFQFELIIELLPSITATGGTLLYIPYIAFATAKQYNLMLSIILNDLMEERTEAEDTIKRKHYDTAKIFMNTYTIILVIAAVGIPLSGFFPYFLDWIIPLNETREMRLLTNGEIFIDQHKYFYYIYFFESWVVLVLCIVVGVSENMSVIVGQHIIGMFEVMGHRLERITEMTKQKHLDRVSYVRLVTRRVHLCIETHQRTLRFAKVIADFYDLPLSVVLVGTFCAVTISMVQITDTKLMTTKMVLFTVVQVFQFFLVSYMGQIGMDASEEITKNAYNAEWDVCPANVRKLLLLIILRSSKPCKVVARNAYTLCIENFMSVMQTAMSFYMVIRQSA